MNSTNTKLDFNAMYSELAGIVGEKGILNAADKSSEYQIMAGMKAFPQNESQVARLLRFANEHRLSVAPRGGGSRDAYSQTTEAVDMILSTKAMSGVLEHSAGDLMVTVLPGTTLLELQSTLKSAGQFLPLDVPWPDISTIGGIVNSGASGFLRAGYGSVRDFLIASRIVYPNGQVIRTGAKVMKNVAGYDMNKLFIGSMGTLGVHTEFTFKIRPIPVGHSLLLIGNTSLETLRIFQSIVLDSQLEPCVFEWMNDETAKLIGIETQQPVVLVGFADVWSSVEQQASDIRSMCKDLGALVLSEFRGADEFERVLSMAHDIMPNANLKKDDQFTVSMKMMGKLTDMHAMYEASEARAAQSELCVNFSGGALVGIARATVEAVGDTAEISRRFIAWISNLQSDMKHIGVRTVVDFAPVSVRKLISIWDESTAEQKIMRGIKRSIDPHEILNPGRIMGGL
jgi:glycolate oxidase FAD binding subunit